MNTQLSKVLISTLCRFPRWILPLLIAITFSWEKEREKIKNIKIKNRFDSQWDPISGSNFIWNDYSYWRCEEEINRLIVW